MLQEKYDPKLIEGKWQKRWAKERAFVAPDPSQDPLGRKKFYSLCMFPYPSGSIHMGHLRNYAIGDIISRYKRMRGYNVMQPPGWDAFGLPAENAAIQRGVHPGDWTLQNIAQMREELKAMGIAYDWEREVTTCLPEYYKHEQALFLRFFKEGRAYRKRGSLNWCPSCQTVLANEQVHEGLCWRCDSTVTKKDLNQWYLRITDYAEQLLEDHAEIDRHWPTRVIEMQKHWIGKSVGCRIRFAEEKGGVPLEVFTTRPDTLFGVTFLTIAPLHPRAQSLCVHDDAKKKLMLFQEEAVKQRPDEVKEKRGFFTGSFAVHPITGEPLPIWIGDFVVMDYGTGAVMGVPAHDERDFEFATTHKLPVKVVITRPGQSAELGKSAFTEAGVLIDSGAFSGMASEEAKGAIAQALERAGTGKATTQYRLRDWGISRQRYWGTPIPIIYCDACGGEPQGVPEADLPVELPHEADFSGKGNPLELSEWHLEVKCPTCGKQARRETDTMDTFVESSWYYARYVSPRDEARPFEKRQADEWLPVDCYIGGVEHACMHLLYARYVHKVLRDWGYLSGNEPFAKLLSQGMVIKDGAKMSKSKGNVVAPTAIIEKYGADTGRLFCLFAAPPEKDLDWNEKGVEGCSRFLTRVWRLFVQFQPLLQEEAKDSQSAQLPPGLLKLRKKAHATIQKVTADLEGDKFNTSISACMELVNEVYGLIAEDESYFAKHPAAPAVLRHALQSLILLLSPFAPHLAEELWASLGFQGLVCQAPWPTFDAAELEEDTIVVVVQINGKVRDKIEVPREASAEEVKALALASERVQAFVHNQPLKKFIYVPGRIANLVV